MHIESLIKSSIPPPLLLPLNCGRGVRGRCLGTGEGERVGLISSKADMEDHRTHLVLDLVQIYRDDDDRRRSKLINRVLFFCSWGQLCVRLFFVCVFSLKQNSTTVKRLRRASTETRDRSSTACLRRSHCPMLWLIHWYNNAPPDWFMTIFLQMSDHRRKKKKK